MVRNILIAFCVILFVSCSKDTESKLFGKWQLQKVEAVSYTHLTLPTNREV